MTLRKLPGRRRGLIEGASLWAADDHLLAVTSYRFRETYRRYYFRDIQAIVVTRCARYGVSTRAVALGLLLLIGCAIPQTRWPSVALLIIAALAWFFLAVNRSCLCRIYTAVSCETLPSVYRTWTAQRFLGEVEPLIAAAQADLSPIGEAALAAAQVQTTRTNPPEPSAPRRSAAAFLLIATILIDAAATAAEPRFPNLKFEWLMYAIVVAQVSAVIWVFVQHRRGLLGKGVQRIAIALLLLIGGTFYGQSVLTLFEQMRAGNVAAQQNRYTPLTAPVRNVYLVICMALAGSGVLVMFGPGPGEG